MDKLLFITIEDLENKRNSGIAKKIWAQFYALEEVFDIYLIGFFGNSLFLYRKGQKLKLALRNKWELSRALLLKKAYKIMNDHGIRKAYIRSFYCDFIFLKIMSKIRCDLNAEILLELPTYPYDMELNSSSKRRILKMLDMITRKRMNKYINYIVTYSEHKNIFNIPCINTINGIQVDSIAPQKQMENDGYIRMVAVASMNAWHGYDRLIRGMGKYYDGNGVKRDIEFHLVGVGDAIHTYKGIVKQYGLEDRVVFHGYKTGAELEEIVNKCTIAIDSLALFRIGLNETSTLKAREYAARGLPIVTAGKVDFLPENNKYLLKLQNSEEPVQIGLIIKFYDRIYTGSTNVDVIKCLRGYAYKYCDISITMKPIIEALSESNNT